MRLLLDTHIALWTIADDPRLKPAARNLIADPNNEKCVSIVSLWEIGLKRATEADGVPVTTAQALDLFARAGFELVALEPHHIIAFESMPVLHGDSFDRMLVAQALAEPLRLLTHDRAVAAYSDTVVFV